MISKNIFPNILYSCIQRLKFDMARSLEYLRRHNKTQIRMFGCCQWSTGDYNAQQLYPGTAANSSVAKGLEKNKQKPKSCMHMVDAKYMSKERAEIGKRAAIYRPLDIRRSILSGKLFRVVFLTDLLTSQLAPLTTID